MSDRIKVVFIAGSGRSGSTLLGNLLGQIDGWVDVGEVHYIWDEQLMQTQVCGCGKAVNDCPFWGPVLGDLSANIDPGLPARILWLRKTLFRSRYLLLPLFMHFRRRNRKELDEYLSGLENTYRSIRKASGANVIVDSSKIPIQAYCLGLIKGIELHIVHLVRDPRAVAYSWSVRRKKQTDARGNTSTLRMRLLRSALVWTAWNYIIGRKARTVASSYRLVRYEDFVRDPETAVRDIRDAVEKNGAGVPKMCEGSIDLEATHTISGNPARFKTGPVPVHEDDEWRRELPAWIRIVVSVLSFKGMLDYGYGFFAADTRRTSKGAGR